MLVTTAQRLNELQDELGRSPELRVLVALDGEMSTVLVGKTATSWNSFLQGIDGAFHRVIDADLAAVPLDDPLGDRQS